MPLEVVIYQSKSRRSREVCAAMFCGIQYCGDRPAIHDEALYKGPTHQVAVFYGLMGHLKQAFADYRCDGRKVVFVDLGFWGRRLKNASRYEGYHKISVNDRHPTAYFQNRRHPPDRLQKFLGSEVKVQPWRQAGSHILLAGMSAKSSWVENMAAEAWERDAVRRLKAVTDRPIIYRPKPSCSMARPIAGTMHSPREQPLEAVLADCHAVVTHHSNVAVDGIVAGIPAFAWDGVAKPMALQDLGRIDDPLRSDEREAWLSDIAYTQWSLDEMRQGLPWRHLRDEGLVP